MQERTVAVTLEDIRSAATALHGTVVETPCLHSRTLSEITGADVFLKFENLQFTASFKERGALIKLLSLSPTECAGGVIAVSAGNHALAVAYHAQRLGIRAVIVMPRTTPNVKVTHTRAYGAEVVLEGNSFDQAHRAAVELARTRHLLQIHPYDDEHVIAGQGTVALEMLTAHPQLEILVVPIGGGGLISGMATAAKALHPSIEVVGVQTAGFPSMRRALDGAPVQCADSTIAEGIAVKQPGHLTLPIVRALVDDIVLVEEVRIEEAVLLLLEVEKTVAEGAGAASLAALLHSPARFAGRKVGLVLSGGNIDLLPLSSIIQRGLVRSGRLVRLHVAIRDIPGALAEVTRCLGDAEANIVQVHHLRMFTSVPLVSAEVEFVIATRGLEHAREVVRALRHAGYEVALPDLPGNGHPLTP